MYKFEHYRQLEVANFKQLLGFINESPLVPSLLIEFRKHLDDETLSEINEMIIDYNKTNEPGPRSGTDVTEEPSEMTENSGTVILDAT